MENSAGKHVRKDRRKCRMKWREIVTEVWIWQTFILHWVGEAMWWC